MCSASGTPRLVVVGGGAAGFMGAIEAARGAKELGSQLEVVVLEATSKCCSKVKISGGGRCNVMHDERKPLNIITNGYPRGQKQLLGPFTRFGPPETAAWFRKEGVTLKTEEDGRMFPTTDNSQTIIDALEGAASRAGVRIRTNVRVESVGKGPDGRFRVATKERKKEGSGDGAVDCDYLLLAPGSSRLAYAWASQLGHVLEDPVPSLFTFNIEDAMLMGLAGLSVQEAEVSVPNPAKPKSPLKQKGPVLITHTGVSGPAILRLSAFGARALHESGYKTRLKINWAPELPRGVEGAMEQILSAKSSEAAKLIGGSNGPTFGLPRRLWNAIVERCGISADAKWGEVKNADLRKVAMNLCACELEVSGKGTFKDEFVTAGGVALKGIDMKLMQSKSVPGLFFAGEIVDIDGITGGYNFQSAWTTGWTAGRSAAALSAQPRGT